jgi:hypothetical protein
MTKFKGVSEQPRDFRYGEFSGYSAKASGPRNPPKGGSAAMVSPPKAAQGKPARK